MIILDTNVVSALMRPAMNAPVVNWVNRQAAADLWTTSITLMEIRIGLYLMPVGRRRDGLGTGFEALLAGALSGRVLPFDSDAAEAASRIASFQKQRGINIEIGDHQIAGIALSRHALIATRNLKDFRDLDIDLIDPWQT